MYLSLNWLKQYVDLPQDLDPKAMSLKFTMSTVEVEGIENQGESLEKIVIGKIEKIEKHPDADRLHVTAVNVGDHTAQIVCGGIN
jgi:phenylalanyl-tRNA synthetase beta chain